ncbi:hypothetical protein H5P28_09545 [Ruficoccus amylovorans]|uniref:Uncharacterized protein n=1 Tax=Ruficoccus amylovorans TaxID=1804625 RepID=A0A842HE53_9BACT|nr:hypothetical protein [Ruficoccus amylovorans]MBC2594500.1 hypothetical protein [Ruficoccus amylovorans]
MPCTLGTAYRDAAANAAAWATAVDADSNELRVFGLKAVEWCSFLEETPPPRLRVRPRMG